MHMDWVLDHVESQVVGGPMTHAGPDAATGHPNTVSLRVMISPLAPTQSRVGFDHRSATKLTTPDHQCVVQQSPLLQIEHQRSAGLVGDRCIAADIADHVGVGIPAFVVQVHEADSALDHSPGQQTRSGEGGLGRVAPVHLQGLRGFPAQVHEFWG